MLALCTAATPMPRGQTKINGGAGLGWRQNPTVGLLATNCSWNTTMDPQCQLPAVCNCSGNTTSGRCGGTCGGCAFSYSYDAHSLTVRKRSHLYLLGRPQRCLVLPPRFQVSTAAPRCLQLHAADGGPARTPGMWYALSASRPLTLSRGVITLRTRAGSTKCPVPFGSYADAESCEVCHVDGQCQLRCECKSGTDSRYVPMGCDLWSCNDLALFHDSLTCRGQICPAATKPACPAPQGSYAAACEECWVDDDCLLRCGCKTPPDGHLTATACDLEWAAAGNCVGGISNDNGILSCTGKPCRSPPIQPFPKPPPSPTPTPPSPPAPPSPPPPPSPQQCEQAVEQYCGHW